MKTIVLSEDEARQLMKETFKDVISEELTASLTRPDSKGWMTSEDVQEYLGINARQLQHLRDTRDIPFSQTGRTIFYPIDDLEEWLRGHMPKEWREKQKN